MNSIRRGLMGFAAACLLQVGVSAQTPLPQHAQGKTLGVGSCSSSLCHGSVEQWKNSSVLQNEYITWSRSDKHARSYGVLLNDLSKEIARKLSMPEPAHKSDLCLDCHTHNPKPEHRSAGYQASDGITCEACHGPAEKWVRSHVEPGATHASNVKRGLYPTGNDVSRTQLCLSCHLGTQDKFVTHKIMAAGHPRMSFEMDTFSELQPRHYKIDSNWEKRKGNWDGVRSWAVGQAIGAKELLNLLQGPRGRDGLFPELVLFDCHSCHHPMADKRNTAARVGAGPGIVRLNDSNLLMLRQITRRVSPQEAEAFGRQVTRMHQAVGSGNDALAQVRSLEQMIASLIPKIGAHRFSNDDLRAMLGGLIEDGLAGQNYNDYQSAEQAVMAVQSVVEVMGKQKLIRTQALRPSMKQLLTSVAHDEKYQPVAFQKALREFKATVETGMIK